MSNTISRTPRGLVLALVMAGVVGGAGAGLISSRMVSAQQTPVVASAISSTPMENVASSSARLRVMYRRAAKARASS